MSNMRGTKRPAPVVEEYRPAPLAVSHTLSVPRGGRATRSTRLVHSASTPPLTKRLRLAVPASTDVPAKATPAAQPSEMSTAGPSNVSEKQGRSVKVC